MERKIILKNTETGQELTMPVTPSSYPMAAGRKVEQVDMAQTGQIALPGLKSLFNETLEVLLPAQLYPFCTSEAVADPSYYLELLTTWSQEGHVCRYIVAGTSVNSPVLLGPIEHGEYDGTNDVTAKIPLYEYRYLEDVQVEQTQNSSRPVETASQPTTPDSYTVQSGDSLWAICKTMYGDGSLAYKLATANSIKNPNLIYPGQVLTLPDAATLASMAATAAPSSSYSKSKAKTTTTTSTTSTATTTTQTTTKAKTAETTAQAEAEVRTAMGMSPFPSERTWSQLSLAERLKPKTLGV
jgi:LysM repeat protein